MPLRNSLIVWYYFFQDTDAVPRFFTKDGQTYSGKAKKVTEFTDFSLKIIGQLREGPNEALGIRNKKGRRLVSLTGYVFSKQQTR